ncbi:MAG: hypothetical protein ACYCYE_02745 [Clostridia bacterium]
MKILKKKKALLLLNAVIIIALTSFVGCQPQSPDKQNTQPQNNAAPAAVTTQPPEQAPEDLKGFTEYTIKKQLGEKSKGGKDRIIGISIEGSDKDRIVNIELNGNDGYTADMTVRGMLMDSRKILDTLSKRKDVSSVSVSEYLDVEDIGGGTVEEWVFTLALDRKGLDNVAGGDYLLNDLTKMAVVYKLHPNFIRSIKQAP